MSNPFARARKYLPLTDEQTQVRVVETNTKQAVKIFSCILEDEIWLILDRSFTPSDGIASYYPEELPELDSKTPDQLRKIHRVKLTFPGCRVIQERVAQ